MKVAFLNGVNSGLDSTRGIGVHTNTLIRELKKLENKDFQIVENIQTANITHITKFNPFFLSIPFNKPSKKVVLTIHDLIPLIYPKHYPPGIKGQVNFAINKFLIKKNVDAIITISETSKKDICRFLGVNPDIVHVVYLAPRPEYKPISNKEFLENVRNKFNLPRSFVFYFGDINYNKNIPTLVEACKSLNTMLVIGGKQANELESMDLSHPENSHLKEIYKDLTNKKTVQRLGFITDEDANAVYNLASVCVQPSLYEGFGLSVIHAMAAGCPVVAGRTQALVEIAEGSCAFSDPNDARDMAQKISQVISDKLLRNQLVETGKVLVRSFTWKKTARETLEVYKHV